MKIEPGLVAIQTLDPKPLYRVSELYGVLGSRATAYRHIDKLEEIGFAQPLKRGYISLRASVFQPYRVWSSLVPSLASLKQARYFGRAYDESDASYARKLLEGLQTLDYRAYDLTHFQTPYTLFTYVEDVAESAQRLTEKGFSEGTKGRVAILPKVGEFDNEIQRVYLDCLANGGRSTLDAIAIELIYGDQLTTKGAFPTDLINKVREDLPSLEPR